MKINNNIKLKCLRCMKSRTFKIVETLDKKDIKEIKKDEKFGSGFKRWKYFVVECKTCGWRWWC